jgi:hypothetical protein
MKNTIIDCDVCMKSRSIDGGDWWGMDIDKDEPIPTFKVSPYHESLANNYDMHACSKECVSKAFALFLETAVVDHEEIAAVKRRKPNYLNFFHAFGESE